MSADIATVVAEGLKAGLPAIPVKEGNPGVLEAIPSWRVFGLSVGDAVKGMAVAGLGDVAVKFLVTKLPTNILPITGVNATSAVAKGIVAALLQSGQSKKFLGANAANLGSLLLTIDAVNDLVQVRTTVSNMVGRLVGGFIPGSGLVWGGRGAQPQPTPVPVPAQSSVVIAAGQVAEDYYSKLGGA